MNPVVKIISSILGTINGLFGSIDAKTAAIIRQIFFMIIFILCSIGIYIGYSSGREAARIKSPPLAEHTSDLFLLDRKMEREEARFGSMLESEQLNEMKYNERAKIPFQSRHDMVPEKREGIIEPESSIKPRSLPETHEGRGIVEGDYSGTDRIKPDVSPLDKKLKPAEPEIIKQKEKEIDVKSIRENKRDRIEGTEKIKTPSPIKKDRGIIEK
jgi:hypothetical protein